MTGMFNLLASTGTRHGPAKYDWTESYVSVCNLSNASHIL